MTALLVAACVLAFGLSCEALLAAFFCAVLVAISAVDLEHRIVPNRIVLPAAAVLLAADAPTRAPSGRSGARRLLFLFLAVLAYPAGMGMGDVKLALLMGAMLGNTVAVALMVGMVAALVPAVVLLARHGSRRGRWGFRSRRSSLSAVSSRSSPATQLLDAYLSLFSSS